MGVAGVLRHHRRYPERCLADRCRTQPGHDPQAPGARMETELAEERFGFIETSAIQREQLPRPEGPITVGIDGGYVKSRQDGQSHFEVTVGKSIPTDRPSRYLGLVQSHDAKPQRGAPKVGG